MERQAKDHSIGNFSMACLWILEAYYDSLSAEPLEYNSLPLRDVSFSFVVSKSISRGTQVFLSLQRFLEECFLSSFLSRHYVLFPRALRDNEISFVNRNRFIKEKREKIKGIDSF